MPVQTSTIGRAAMAAVSRPSASTPMAAEVLGCATALSTTRRNASTLLAARPPNRGSSTATASRLAHEPSSGDRATLPFSRTSLRCLAVGCSVR